MNKLYFAIVLHFHQPVGNFEEVVERAYANCYKPFFDLLSSYPDICMTVHFSGCLLDYLEQRHPETVDFIKLLASRRQIEIIGGPYYEPVLTAIPQRDAIGQISMMSTHIKERFGLRPQGIWVPERVWEPGLAATIARSGMRYCALDETILRKARMGKEDIGGYLLTGKKRKIAVFPFDKKLRYLIPFKLPNKTINYLKEVASKKVDFLLTYADDGEKFGEWKGTHEWVYKNGWLRDFFDALLSNKDWIRLVTLSDYMNSHEPVDTLEIPEGSYDEMTEWAEGSWKNFLSKYPESAQMQNKAMYVSEKIEKLKKTARKKDADKIVEAKKELYKGQCNCAYWHGLYGGLYFYHLRNEVFKHLIEADKIADSIIYKGKKKYFKLKQIDFDADGKKEYLMESETFSLYFDPSDGGVLKELDYKPLSVNLINTLSRKKERYHRVSHPLDRYTRHCLRDHLISENLKKADFVKGAYEEIGSPDINNYTAKGKKSKLVLERKCLASAVELKLTKEIEIKSSSEIVVLYRVEKNSQAPLSALFAVEFNMTMPFLNAERYRYTCNNKEINDLNANSTAIDVASFGIIDLRKDIAINLSFSKTAGAVWYFPIKTISQSEKRYDRNYQASCIVPKWWLNFGKGKKWDLKIKWTFA